MVMRRSEARSGIALITALLLVVSAGSMALLLMSYASSTSRSVEVRRQRLAADYLAEGGVEAVRAAIQAELLVGREPALEGEVLVGGQPVGYTLTEVSTRQVRPTADGLQAFVTEYAIECRADVPGAHSRSRRLVRAEVTPIFQFALFYENDLEIWPGPPMVLGGPVRCNGDMYVGAGRSLTFDTNYIRVAGKLHLHRKHSTSVNSGEIWMRRFVEDPYDPSLPRELVPLPNQTQLAALGIPSASGLDSAFDGFDADGDGSFMDPGDALPYEAAVLDLFSEPDFYAGTPGFTLLTQEHDVGTARAPRVDEIAMFVEQKGATGGNYSLENGRFVEVPPGSGSHRKGAFHEQAGLSILRNRDGTWSARDANGIDVTAGLRNAVRTDSLYDARQEAYIDVVTVDLDALGRSGLYPSNGLLYAASYGAGEGADVKGIRLVNGAELAGPLTVVSEDSIYVQGDYNTISKKPAAVISDAVNLLSNAWDDSKAPGTLPVAADTTYNLSIISGNTESTAGQYNGGVENLPRFHENWRNKKCTFRGSMVVLWYSRYATARWGKSNVYRPPIRDWSFDPDLADLANMPPFSPAAANVRDVVSW